MNYYLSYIETKSHASILLSVEESPNEPVKILRNIGFWPRVDFAGNPDVDVGTFKNYDGYITDENTISKILYSNSTIVSHVTFQISALEKATFDKIIADDQKVNKAPFIYDKKLHYAGGRDYQYLKYNCKTYALSVFKRLGIVEVNQLSNFLIERPASKKSKVKPINKNQMICPEKDAFIKKFKEMLEDLKINLNRKVDESDNKYLQKNISLLLAEVKFAEKKVNKLGFDWDIGKCFDNLSLHLINVVNDTDKGHELFSTYFKQFSQFEVEAKKIEKKYKNYELQFFWKKTPPLSMRTQIFANPIEGKFIKINIKLTELEHTFFDIQKMLQQAKSEPKNDNLFLNDIDQISLFVKEAENKLISLKSKINCHQVKSTQLNNEIEKIIKHLNNKLVNFKPQHKRAWIFIRIIQQLLSYLIKDYVPLDVKIIRNISVKKINLFASDSKMQKDKKSKPILLKRNK